MECCCTQLAIGTGLICFFLYCIRKYFDGGVCHSKARLDGKTAIITGGNTGIGKETAIDLAKRGAKVIIACRSAERGEEALKEIKNAAQTDLVFFKRLDLASLASVRQFAASINASEKRLDILINNAGVMMCPKMLTEDGFEMQIGVNHFGHFLLTNLLLDLIKRSAPSRIVNVSSRAHGFSTGINFDDINSERSYSRIGAYGQSKLANVLFTKELHRRLQGSNVSVFAVHPGAVNTELDRHVFGKYVRHLKAPVVMLLYKNAWQGAQTQIYCAVQEGIEHQSGLYFSDCAPKVAAKPAQDESAAKRLWDVSEKLVGVK